MFIWRGWGVLVFFIVFLVSLIANFTADILGGKGYWNTHAWPLASALIIAGGLIWMTDVYFFRKPARVLLDEKTGAHVTLVNKSDLILYPDEMVGPHIRRVRNSDLGDKHGPPPLKDICGTSAPGA